HGVDGPGHAGSPGRFFDPNIGVNGLRFLLVGAGEHDVGTLSGLDEIAFRNRRREGAFDFTDEFCVEVGPETAVFNVRIHAGKRRLHGTLQCERPRAFTATILYRAGPSRGPWGPVRGGSAATFAPAGRGRRLGRSFLRSEPFGQPG